MFECPHCKNIHFEAKEFDFRPKSLAMYAIICTSCKEVITYHEKGIADALELLNDRLEEILSKL